MIIFHKLKKINHRSYLGIMMMIYIFFYLMGLREINGPYFFIIHLFSLYTIYINFRKKTIKTSLIIFLKILNEFKYFICLFSLSVLMIFFIIKYVSLKYNTWDVGFFANITSNLANNFTFYSDIFGINSLGEHFHPVLILISPLFHLYNSFVWFPILHFTSYFLTLILLIKYSYIVYNSKTDLRSCVVPLMFLFNYYYFKTVDYEIQIEQFSHPFIVLIFLFIEKEQKLKMFFFLSFILLFKENQAIVWVSVGFYYIFFKKRYSIGLIIVIFGIIFGLLTQLVLIPYFNPNDISNHAGKFGPLVNIQEKIIFIYEGLKNISFLPLFSISLLPAYFSSYSLTFAAKELFSWNFHYQGLPLIITFILLNHLIKKITELKLNYYLKYSLILFLIIFYLNKNNSLALDHIYDMLPTDNALNTHKEIQILKHNLSNYSGILYTDERLGPYFASHHLRSLDQWSGYQQILNEKKPHYVLMTKKPVSELPKKKYIKFLRYFISSENQYSLKKDFKYIYFFKLD